MLSDVRARARAEAWGFAAAASSFGADQIFAAAAYFDVSPSPLGFHFYGATGDRDMFDFYEVF